MLPLVFSVLIWISLGQMPLPFKRVLKVTTPVMEGNDVLIATTLMSRCSAWPNTIAPSNKYTQSISNAVATFQTGEKISSDGIFGANTANAALRDYSFDTYKDDGIKASDYGVLYKLYVPVYNDSARNVELNASLYDRDNNLLLTFKARTHGQSNPPSSQWPNYDNKPGLNQFTSNGNTMTGLSYIDLNSPEPSNEEKYYGPYPIQRVISGIVYKNITSNAALLLQPQSTNIRSGILMHTGEWPGWKDGDQMPDSDGCMHVWPDVLNEINNILTKQLGVKVNDNPFSSHNYPYKPQGIISVQQIF